MKAALFAIPLVLGLAAPAPAGEDGLRIAQIIAPPSSSGIVATTEPPEQRYPWRFPRSATDRADERTGNLIHVVYLIPAGGFDDRFDELGMIEDSMRSQNAWMRQQTGNRQEWRLDTYTITWDDPATPEVESIRVEAVDVTTIKSTRSDDQLDSVSEVDDELIARGLDAPNKRYLSYVASNAGGVCGDAWYPLFPPSGPVDGKYSDIYLYSASGCRARDFAPNATTPFFTETIAMQEMVHNDGMVPLSAPHNCVVSLLAFAHVCTGPLWATELDPERFDVMYPYVGLPLNEKKLDEDRLDYYGHLAPYRDLDESFYLTSV